MYYTAHVQEEVAVKFPQSTLLIHKKIQRIHQQQGTQEGTERDCMHRDFTRIGMGDSHELQKEILRARLQQHTATQMRADQKHASELAMAHERIEQKAHVAARLQAEEILQHAVEEATRVKFEEALEVKIESEQAAKRLKVDKK
jgi:hypothetical protein